MPSHDPTEVRVVAHPPERRRQRSGAPAQAGQCCCCCCCLHTLGGLIGALVAPATVMARPSAPRTQEEDDYGERESDGSNVGTIPGKAGISAAAVFWWSTLILILIVLGVSGLRRLNGNQEAILVALFALALLLPGLQLVAVIPPALLLRVLESAGPGVRVRPTRPHPGRADRRDGHGILVMVGLVILLRAL